MNARTMTLRQWVEMTLELDRPCCEIHPKVRLELVWIGDENDPTAWYIHCPKKSCEREYGLVIGFYPLVIPEG